MFILYIGDLNNQMGPHFVWPLTLFLVSSIFYYSIPTSSTFFSSHSISPLFSFLSFSPLFPLFLGFLAPRLVFGSQPGCPNIQNLQPCHYHKTTKTKPLSQSHCHKTTVTKPPLHFPCCALITCPKKWDIRNLRYTEIFPNPFEPVSSFRKGASGSEHWGS